MIDVLPGSAGPYMFSAALWLAVAAAFAGVAAGRFQYRRSTPRWETVVFALLAAGATAGFIALTVLASNAETATVNWEERTSAVIEELFAVTVTGISNPLLDCADETAAQCHQVHLTSDGIRDVGSLTVYGDGNWTLVPDRPTAP